MLELEDLSVEMAKPPEQVVITYSGDGEIVMFLTGLDRVEATILASTALGALQSQLTPEEEEEIERWLESD